MIMTFNEGARLDPSQAEDQRGRSGMGRGGKVGLGLGGGIVVLIGALLGINPDMLSALIGDSQQERPWRAVQPVRTPMNAWTAVS